MKLILHYTSLLKAKYLNLFKPNGDYMQTYQEQAEAFYGNGNIPFSIAEFVKYHAQDSNYTSSTRNHFNKRTRA